MKERCEGRSLYTSGRGRGRSDDVLQLVVGSNAWVTVVAMWHALLRTNVLGFDDVPEMSFLAAPVHSPSGTTGYSKRVSITYTTSSGVPSV